jgi:predicted ArsR family transcriptional regulator
VDEIDEAILIQLAEGPWTPFQIAQAIGVDRDLVRERLDGLEDLGLVVSIPRARRILFFLVTGEVLTSETYDRIMEIIEDLRGIFDRYRGRSGDPGLARELRGYLEDLATRPELASRAERIAEFREELLATLSERSAAAARNLVGLRPLTDPWRLTEEGETTVEELLEG